MMVLRRYTRVFLSFARNCLVRDMTFRTNFVIKVVTDLLWLGLLLIFFGVIFLSMCRSTYSRGFATPRCGNQIAI